MNEICHNLISLNNNTKAHLGLIGTNIFFAMNISMVKHLTNNGFIKPFGLNLVRIGVSVLLFWVLFLFKPVNPSIRKKDIPRFLLCALTGIALNQMFFISGVSLTYSIHSSLLILITPILITVMGVLFLKDKMTVYKVAGLVFGISGASTLILFKENSGSGSNVLLGDLLIVCNATVYALYFILVKPLMQHYNPLQVIRWVFTFGLLMVLPFCWNDFMEIRTDQYSAIEWLDLISVVIGGTFLAYIFNIYGIKVLGPAVAGEYIYTQPFFAAVIAMVFMHESLDLYKIIAALLIFAGVYLSNKKTKEKSLA